MSRSFVSFVIFACSMHIISCAKAPPPTPASNPDGNQNEEAAQDWSGTMESFTINSTPSGANVRLSSGEKCKTPCNLKRDITENFDATIEKNGFRSKTISVVSHTNVLPGSGATGRPKLSKPKLSPNPASVTLEPVWDR